MKAVVASGEACLSMTLYDGLRLARSGFESSIAYRSVVVFGAAALVSDDAEKARVLNMFVDAVLPGRAREVRPMSDAERRLTMVVAVRIDEASAKLSSGPTDDPDEDQGLPVWSGTVPARILYGDPVPDTNGAMAAGTIPGARVGGATPGLAVTTAATLRTQIEAITIRSMIARRGPSRRRSPASRCPVIPTRG